mmetsp:Transcript_55060/g.101926  ORF Transcript_55060/g.101926 Transcript_55060/m.101926 type:complete len:200 (+) Transcript_55060:127-726(+)
MRCRASTLLPGRTWVSRALAEWPDSARDLRKPGHLHPIRLVQRLLVHSKTSPQIFLCGKSLVPAVLVGFLLAMLLTGFVVVVRRVVAAWSGSHAISMNCIANRQRKQHPYKAACWLKAHAVVEPMCVIDRLQELFSLLKRSLFQQQEPDVLMLLLEGLDIFQNLKRGFRERHYHSLFHSVKRHISRHLGKGLLSGAVVD